MFAVICVVLYGNRAVAGDDSGLGCDGLQLLLEIIKCCFFSRLVLMLAKQYKKTMWYSLRI